MILIIMIAFMSSKYKMQHFFIFIFSKLSTKFGLWQW